MGTAVTVPRKFKTQAASSQIYDRQAWMRMSLVENGGMETPISTYGREDWLGPGKLDSVYIPPERKEDSFCRYMEEGDQIVSIVSMAFEYSG